LPDDGRLKTETCCNNKNFNLNIDWLYNHIVLLTETSPYYLF
jgi:hypothetical protein